MTRVRNVLPLACFALATFLTACQSASDARDGACPTAPSPDGMVTAQVVNVVDGDTIDVLINGQQRRVRYIGIDAPETVASNRKAEPFGQEASERNRSLVDGRAVCLERDLSETDQFMRLLRYVWLNEDTMVNGLLVSEGLALARPYPPDVKYADVLEEFEIRAKEHGRGLWAMGQTSAVTFDTTHVP